jgi:hypothetical protein
MPRKNRKKQPISPVFAPVGKPSDDSSAMLVNNLSVKDARHLMGGEGELEASQIAIRVISIIVVASTCAWAIWAGKATAWHLFLPMVAEYFAILIGVIIAFVIVRHPAMKKDARGGFILLNVIAIILAASAWWRAHQQQVTWQAQLDLDANAAWAWIRESHMHWPMLAAVVAVFLDLPYRVGNLLRLGPPFVAVGLGCGMRVAVFALAVFLLPFVASGNAVSNAWILWGLLLLAEVLTLWMHWDIQSRLKERDAIRD